MRNWSGIFAWVWLAGVTPGLAATSVSPQQAVEIAKAQIYAECPEMKDPMVEVLVKTATTKVVRYVFSEPFPVNNETLWNIRTQYIWFGDPEEEFSGVGSQPGPQAVVGPQPGDIDPAVKPQTIRYLSNLSSNHFLNPGLRTIASQVTVHLVAFHKKSTEPGAEKLKAVGVDEDGRLFRPNTFSPLMPLQWPPTRWQK
jgi:hypothetical protein